MAGTVQRIRESCASRCLRVNSGGPGDTFGEGAEKEGPDQHYAARFAGEPAARAAWEAAYRTYREWWVGTAALRLTRGA